MATKNEDNITIKNESKTKKTAAQKETSTGTKAKNTTSTTKKINNKKESNTAKNVQNKKVVKNNMEKNETVNQTQKTANKKQTEKPNKKPRTEKLVKTNVKAKTKKDNLENKKTKNNKNTKGTKQEQKNQNNIDLQEIEKTFKQERKAKRLIPEEIQNKMNAEVFKNIFIAIAVVVFLNFIILGFINIESSVFIVDLKVFALILLATSIGVFEYAYKKDSGKIAIYGIETLVLALCMLGFIYLNLMFNSKFVIIVILTTYVFAIYYTIKSVVMYNKIKKQYNISKMKNIIKK